MLRWTNNESNISKEDKIFEVHNEISAKIDNFSLDKEHPYLENDDNSEIRHRHVQNGNINNGFEIDENIKTPINR